MTTFTDDQFVHWMQAELQARGLYSGRIDGQAGPATKLAVEISLRNDPRKVPDKAVVIPVASAPGAPLARIESPLQSQLAAFYGPAGGPACTSGRAKLPFAFPLAWDEDQQVQHIVCHSHVDEAIAGIFADAARHYGEEQFRKLRLDQFGGCYNFRVMRGGSNLSTHAWGIAVDVDPTNNQLRWNKSQAKLAKADYEPFWKIVESYGAVSLGRSRDYDWMHFQFCRIG